MVLNNVLLIGNNEPLNIQIRGSRILGVSKKTVPEKTNRLQLTFNNALAFPGLINAHDHLDFNLFPKLGDKTYKNYTEWGKHIHETYKQEIADVLKVPVALREDWGMLKNLVCGVTTVVNHGEKTKTQNRLINVYEQYQCLHSVQFEKNWKIKLNNPLKFKLPVIIHTGEGIDRSSRKEVSRLIRWNFLRRTLIGVHGVAMVQKQAKKFKALVWCPESNFFLFNKTAPVNKLKNYTTILFGTDSALTSGWNIWDHIRTAHQTNMLGDVELYNTFSINAADALKTQTAKIKQGKKADIVIARAKTSNDMETFFSTNPEDILLVLHNGAIRLFDAELYPQLAEIDTSAFSKIYINGTCKYVNYDVPQLIKDIKQYYPEASFPVTVE